MDWKVLALTLSVLVLCVHCQEQTPVQTEFLIPDVPAPFNNDKVTEKASGFLNIWNNRIYQHNKANDGLVRGTENEKPVPRTLVTVSYISMVNLIPQDAPHPLYSEEFKELTDEFILDSLSADVLSPEALENIKPGGITLKSLSGKNLVIKKDSGTDKLTLNGINVDNVHYINEEGGDPVTVIVLSDFLFNLYQEVQDAFQKISSSSIYSGHF